MIFWDCLHIIFHSTMIFLCDDAPSDQYESAREPLFEIFTQPNASVTFAHKYTTLTGKQLTGPRKIDWRLPPVQRDPVLFWLPNHHHEISRLIVWKVQECIKQSDSLESTSAGRTGQNISCTHAGALMLLTNEKTKWRKVKQMQYVRCESMGRGLRQNGGKK